MSFLSKIYSHYLVVPTECVAVSKAQMLKTKHKEFSKKYFTKALLDNPQYWAPLFDIPIVVKKLSSNVGGQYDGKKIFIEEQQGWQDQQDSLLHEMIHQAVYEWALDLSEPPHGPEFQKLYMKIFKHKWPG